jgi:hypothetical protein
VTAILLVAPVTTEEHLVHGWDALRAASEAARAWDEAKHAKNVKYAKERARRAEFAARDEFRPDPAKLATALREVEALRAEIRSA